MPNVLRHGEAYRVPERAPTWPTAAPSEVGIDPERLERASEFARENQSDSLVVLRYGKLVREDYWNGKSARSVQQTYSGTKSVFALLIGRLIERGILSGLEQPLCELIAELPGRLRQVTFENIMAMQSGVANSPEIEELGGTGQTQLEIALGREIEAEPFTKYYYNNAMYRLLFTAVERASGRSLEELTRDEVFVPLGFDGAYWLKLYGVDEEREIFRGYQSICMTPRDFAKSSQVILDRGRWRGQRYLSESFISRLTSVVGADENPSFGLFHHLNAGSYYRERLVPERIDRKLVPGAPDDTFLMFGVGGQVTVGIPSLDLVLVRTGDGVALYEAQNTVATLVKLLVDAVQR
jgi:CubicO group peptidase (beta-lactamase class C family)